MKKAAPRKRVKAKKTQRKPYVPEGGIVGKKSRENISKQKGKKRAKTYVEPVYPPNGVGPDTDLILLLEREVVR